MPRKNLKIASMRVATLIPTRMMGPTTLELVERDMFRFFKCKINVVKS